MKTTNQVNGVFAKETLINGGEVVILCVQAILCRFMFFVYIYCRWRYGFKSGRDEIILNGLSHISMSAQKQDLDFQRHMLWFLSCVQ